MFIVAAYGKLLPPEILALPPLGCVNIHASLLPRWRGAAPINRAVMAGDAVGGVTVMYMAEGLDTGDMILKKELPIPPQMTAGEYHDRLAVLGGEAINEYLALAASGTVPREKQDDASATYAAKLTDDDRGWISPPPRRRSATASAASRRRPARIAFTAGNGSSCSPPSRRTASGRRGKSSARETARSPSPAVRAPSL